MKKIVTFLLVAFITVSSLYVSAIFIFPLLRIPFAPLFFSGRNPDPYRVWNFYLFLDAIPFVGVMISYLIYLIFCVCSLYFPQKLFTQQLVVQYWRYERLHRILLVLTIPFLFTLGFVLFYSSVLHAQVNFGTMTVVFITFLWIVWFMYHRKVFSKIFAMVSILFAFYGIVFLTFDSIPEIHPQVYGKFNLNDPKGIYMINYDGDYWLTYYINKPICWQKNVPGGLEKVCKDSLVKYGNTVIIEAPTNLQSYLDKQVKVEGSFVAVLPPIYPDNPYREFCVTKPKRICQNSKGNGIWFFSPVKLQSIKALQ